MIFEDDLIKNKENKHCANYSLCIDACDEYFLSECTH